MKKALPYSLFFSFFFVGLCLSQAFAYDWPTPDFKIRKNFAQRTGNSYEPGLEFETTASNLNAPEKGQVIFSFTPDTGSAQNLPSSLGGFVVVAHSDQLRTLVSGLQPQPWLTSVSVASGDPLGTIPNAQTVTTSPTPTRHQLMVFDQQLGEIVNPLLVFPPRADERSPIILDVKLVGDSPESSASLFAHSHFSVGYWTLYVDAVDPGSSDSGNSQKGLYSVSAYLNGNEVFRTALTSLQDKNGQFTIKGTGKPLSDVIVGDHEWRLGKIFLNQGTNILELVVKDFQGKESGKTFHILGSSS